MSNKENNKGSFDISIFKTIAYLLRKILGRKKIN